jgi:hypothetical protein
MPLQKSFSETNHSSKVNKPLNMSKQAPITNSLDQKRPQWSRNKTVGGPEHHKNDSISKPLQPKPAIPVSTASKTKLGAFKFDEQSNAASKPPVISLMSQDEKENSNVIRKGTKTPSQRSPNGRGDIPSRRDTASDSQPRQKLGAKDVNDSSIVEQDATHLAYKPNQGMFTRDGNGLAAVETDKSSSKTAPGDSTSDFPSTPAARLALPDLIGMGDVRRAVQDISPEDRIEWDQHASTRYVTRKVKKRTRSVSPVSSPASQPSNPQLDPGSELWGRYSLNGSNAPTPQGPTIPALAHIMHTCSPQATREGSTPRTVAGLRRTTSCGTQFPKRRRVGVDNDDVFTESASIGPSKLAVLIERVQEGMVHSTQPKSDSNVSSSPIPDITPSRRFEGRAPPQQKGSPSGVHETTALPQPTEKPVMETISNGSDYGDFDDADLDEASLLEVFSVKPEIPTIQPSFSSKSKLPPDPPLQSRLSTETRPTLVPLAPWAAQVFDATTTTEQDDFGDFDEELFAEFDNGSGGKVISPSKRQSSSNLPKEAVKSESDDEFGDGGLDDLDFEVAEAAATQSIQQTSNSLLPVRPRYS